MEKKHRYQRRHSWGSDLRSLGEPYVWGMGGAVVIGVGLILSFLGLIVYNGAVTFIPKPLEQLYLKHDQVILGEKRKTEYYQPDSHDFEKMSAEKRRLIEERGYGERSLYRVGNYDLYNEDFKWVNHADIQKRTIPKDAVFVERQEWGPFVGYVTAVTVDGQKQQHPTEAHLKKQLELGNQRREKIRYIERGVIGEINTQIEKARLNLRQQELSTGKNSPAYRQLLKEQEPLLLDLDVKYQEQAELVKQLKATDQNQTLSLEDAAGQQKIIRISEVIRLYQPNNLSFFDKATIYASRWHEFLTDEPREANTEGGVAPAIFGTVIMTLLLAIAVAPFGVVAALYLREYAKQGRLVSLIRISVNNLAGVPSIVYGVFGLGFFAYMLGANLDQWLFAERLPSPTFGTGGILWASLTLALLTVPVVIVSTEEALSSVPNSMREGSLACGASKWQTIKNIVLPRALPGIMTGLILAMARGAGEVAPLMLVGVVKLAPELPIDLTFPYLHLERSFMHLGFHIYDVGFQSRNSEAGRPMVFVTTLLLIGIVFCMNAFAIFVRGRLKRRFATGGQF